MTKPLPDIVLIADRIDPNQLAELLARSFSDMVKYVVDLERGIAAVGGELHADAEQLLLDDGSRQEDHEVRDRVRALTYRLIGPGESLP